MTICSFCRVREASVESHIIPQSFFAARSVAGVTMVQATQFQPQGVNTTQYLTAGQIKLGSLQVARLDNDPNYPDHGQLTLVMQGGK